MPDADRHEADVRDVHPLLARTLALPVITVAALQGHTVAAGATFALAHDLRVMRADRGSWRLPEADIGDPVHPRHVRPDPGPAGSADRPRGDDHGAPYGAATPALPQIVDSAVPEDAVRSTAVELAAAQTGIGRRHPRHDQEPPLRAPSSTSCVDRTGPIS